MGHCRKSRFVVAILSVILLLTIAAVFARPALAQAGSGVTGTWISNSPTQPNGSFFRTFYIFRANGAYQSTTITLNGPPSIARIDGQYTVESQGPGQYRLHIEQTAYAPKQICIQGGGCNALKPPLPTIDDQVSVNDGVMRFASGLVAQRGTIPPQIAGVVPQTRMVNRPAPTMGGMQGPRAQGGSGGSGSHGPDCRNNVEQQKCISLGGNSYMYTDSRGCRVCQYVP